MKKILFIFSSIFISQNAFANQPVDWQLGFQKAASESMRDIVAFHDNLLLPIIIAISVFVLFLMLYACVRFRASANPNPSKRTHNVTARPPSGRLAEEEFEYCYEDMRTKRKMLFKGVDEGKGQRY